jgi:hypothetical protein
MPIKVVAEASSLFAMAFAARQAAFTYTLEDEVPAVPQSY